MAQRYSSLDITQELTRALVRTMNGYMEQGVKTMYSTVLRRMMARPVSDLRSVVNGQAIKVSFAAGASMGTMASLFTADAVARTNPQVAQMGQLFATAVEKKVARREGVLAIHQTAAQLSQQAVIASYNRLVEDVSHPRYREGQDRLPRKLGEALARPDFNQATADGVLFANVGMLDAVAAHWYRLNFGAGSRGSAFLSNAQTNRVTFFGQLVGTLKLAGEPSAAFIVPKGIFLNGQNAFPWDVGRRGSDAFIPAGMIAGLGFKVRSQDPSKVLGGPVLSRGVVARHFLDAGVQVLANYLPRQYEVLVKQWLQEASKEAGRRGPLGGLAPSAAQGLAGSITLGQGLVRGTLG